MPWAKLDDDLWHHPKMDYLHGAAFELYVCSLAYCAERLNDGVISEDEALRLARFRGVPVEIIEGLCASPVRGEGPFWERTPGGFLVHNYLKRNPSREQWMQRRDSAFVRQATHRARDTLGKEESRHAVTNGVSNGAPNGPPVPVPGPVSGPGKHVHVAAATPPDGGKRARHGRPLTAGEEEARAMFEALVATFGYKLDALNQAQRGYLNKTEAMLRQSKVRPDQVADLLALVRSELPPGSTITPSTLPRYAHLLGTQAARLRGGGNGRSEPHYLNDAEADERRKEDLAWTNKVLGRSASPPPATSAS